MAEGDNAIVVGTVIEYATVAAPTVFTAIGNLIDIPSLPKLTSDRIPINRISGTARVRKVRVGKAGGGDLGLKVGMDGGYDTLAGLVGDDLIWKATYENGDSEIWPGVLADIGKSNSGGEWAVDLAIAVSGDSVYTPAT